MTTGRNVGLPMLSGGHDPEDPRWWRIARWLFLLGTLWLPTVVPMPLWPIVWTLLGILLVLQFDLHGLPIRTWDWLAKRGQGVRLGQGYEPGWYGFQGRTLRGLVDDQGELWFPLHDLALPAASVNGIRHRYGPTEIRRFGLTTYLSVQGLQRYLNAYRTEELRAMRLWVERVAMPAHRRYRERL